MSLTLRRIAAVVAIALVGAVVLAPHANATTTPVTTKPVVTLVGADHKTPVGTAVYNMTQSRASVWAVLDHPLANTDYKVSVVIVHVGYSASTYKMCTFHTTSTARAGCLGANIPITLHHNDIPLIVVTHGSPTKTDTATRI